MVKAPLIFLVMSSKFPNGQSTSKTFLLFDDFKLTDKDVGAAKIYEGKGT